MTPINNLLPLPLLYILCIFKYTAPSGSAYHFTRIRDTSGAAFKRQNRNREEFRQMETLMERTWRCAESSALVRKRRIFYACKFSINVKMLVLICMVRCRAEGRLTLYQCLHVIFCFLQTKFLRPHNIFMHTITLYCVPLPRDTVQCLHIISTLHIFFTCTHTAL